MRERPDVDEMKEKLKGAGRDDQGGDALLARLSSKPGDAEKDTESEGTAISRDGGGSPSDSDEASIETEAPRDIPLESLPKDDAESMKAGQPPEKEYDYGNTAGEADEEIETFTRDGGKITALKDIGNDTHKAEKVHQEKNRKNRKKRRKINLKPKRVHVYIGLLALALLSVSALIWYVFSSASSVKEINIAGNALINDEEIHSRLQFSEGDKMFSINTGRAAENIALLPAVDEVTVERSWWNGVDVNISEHRAVGYVANGDSYYPVLENARVLRGYPATPNSAPILHYFEGEEFDALVSGLNEIEPDILEGISEIYYRPSQNSATRIHMFMNDGQEVVADYRTLDDKMNHYIGMRSEIEDSGAGIIDLEIGSSFLPYGSSEAQDIKQGIYETPVQARYIEDVNGSLGKIKDVLSGFEDGEE